MELTNDIDQLIGFLILACVRVVGDHGWPHLTADERTYIRNWNWDETSATIYIDINGTII